MKKSSKSPSFYLNSKLVYYNSLMVVNHLKYEKKNILHWELTSKVLVSWKPGLASVIYLNKIQDFFPIFSCSFLSNYECPLRHYPNVPFQSIMNVHLGHKLDNSSDHSLQLNK